MTGILGLALPPWLSPTLIGAVAITIAAGCGGAWIDHKFMMGDVNAAKLETARVQSSYDGYKATVAASAAKATADSLQQTNSLNALIDALQGKLAEQQRVANAKSEELRKLLASAKPGDTRPIGPVASSYYERLRGP